MAKKQLSFTEELEELFGECIKREDKKLEVISTGSVSLDFSTGVGGIPIGKFTEIYGVESSGKTTLALTIAKNAILSGGKVLYVDAENGLEWSRVEQICPEANTDTFFLVQPDTIETGFTIAEKALESKEFKLIVYDSVAAGVSKTVQDDELEKANVASLSRIISRFVSRNTFDIRDADTAFIFINQVRDKIGAYIPTLESPGGHALKHICSLRILLSSDLSKEGKILDKEDAVIGNYCKFTIKKNKMGRPYRSYSFPIMYETGIDAERDLVVFSEVLGVIERSGAWYSFEGEKIGQGLANTIEYLKINTETLDKIKYMVYNMISDENKEITEEQNSE